MIVEIEFFLAELFGRIGINFWFWLGYFRLLEVTSLIVYLVQFKYELSKPYPRIPYEQDFP